jgi:hypothetical protein
VVLFLILTLTPSPPIADPPVRSRKNAGTRIFIE